jgi:hypothetical protein
MSSLADRLARARLRRALVRAYPVLEPALEALSEPPDPRTEGILDGLEITTRLHRGGLNLDEALHHASEIVDIPADTLRRWRKALRFRGSEKT